MTEMTGKGDSDVKINCVILNYNDADTVLKLVSEIRGYQALDRIVVVDNASTDDSAEKLRKGLDPDKTDLICSERNGGYGAGNNLGVRYAVEQNGADHVLIANPDVLFSESCVKALSGVLKRHAELAAAAASMKDAAFGNGRNGWKLHGFMGELLAMGPVCRRVFNRFLTYPESYFEGKKAVYVDAVHGSMLMVNGRKFLSAGGYDEGIFLYQEEAVLGTRLKRAGYKTVLLLNREYIHEHSVSISKSFRGQMDRQKLRNDSVRYYLREYHGIGPVREWFANLWFAAIMLEIRIAGILGII